VTISRILSPNGRISSTIALSKSKEDKVTLLVPMIAKFTPLEDASCLIESAKLENAQIR